MSDITLNGRYGLKHKLEPLGNNKYKLHTDGHYRIGYKESIDNIEFIDPEGGPFIRVGCLVEEVGARVKSITKDKIIEFDDISSNSK